MAFLDLEEVLGEQLGYAAAVPDRRELFEGFRIYGGQKPSTDESRASKRLAWGRYAEKKRASSSPRREYRRHPPGTPRHLMGDVEKRKARVRERVRDKRRREAEDRKAERQKVRAIVYEEKRMTANERFQDFFRRLKAAKLVDQAKIVCVGRAVYDERYCPDVRQLYEGRDPEHFAARGDFFVWLRHPQRAWSVDAIAELFDLLPPNVRTYLSTRTKYAGEDLDDR